MLTLTASLTDAANEAAAAIKAERETNYGHAYAVKVNVTREDDGEAVAVTIEDEGGAESDDLWTAEDVSAYLAYYLATV